MFKSESLRNSALGPRSKEMIRRENVTNETEKWSRGVLIQKRQKEWSNSDQSRNFNIDLAVL